MAMQEQAPPVAKLEEANPHPWTTVCPPNIPSYPKMRCHTRHRARGVLPVTICGGPPILLPQYS